MLLISLALNLLSGRGGHRLLLNRTNLCQFGSFFLQTKAELVGK